jgi:Zn2+/Cd2+-exporting ATPase
MDCAARLERAVTALPGVTRAVLNFGAAKLSVEGAFDPKAVIREAAQHDGVTAQLDGAPVVRVTGWARRLPEIRMAMAGSFILAGWILGLLGYPPGTGLPLFGVAMLCGGYTTTGRGVRALARLQFDMNGMMTGALIGAALIGQWEEGAAVAFLYAVSNWLERYTMDRARRSIRALMDLAPKEARVRRNGSEILIPVQELLVGDLLLIRPGEKVASDGIVQSGNSAVDQSPITGESVPVDKVPGDRVYGGSLNGHGALDVAVTQRVEDTTLSRIIHLVEEAQAQRAPSQQFVDRFARVYTPAVFALAIGLMLVPLLPLGQPWTPWIYRGLALLIISCPCALVVSTPVTIVSAIATAARHGILIKGGAYLEELGRLQAVALDKTGTLTRGEPELTDVIPTDGRSPESLLALAAAVEAQSEHPLARAVVRAAKYQSLPLAVAEGFMAIPGKGGWAIVGGQAVYVGSPRLFAEMRNVSRLEDKVASLQREGKTVMLVGTRQGVLGMLALADQLRPESRQAIAGLRAAGIRHIALLTGDNRDIAERIASEIGADTLRSEILPAQKLEAVRALRAEFDGLAMIGDGVNDAPALAASSVGIAMGVAGSDVALETADVALMADDLSRLPFLVGLGQTTARVIRQNIGVSIAIKAIAIAAVFPGWLTLWLAILGDMGASVLVTLNGMRLLRVRSVFPTGGLNECGEESGHGTRGAAGIHEKPGSGQTTLPRTSRS